MVFAERVCSWSIAKYRWSSGLWVSRSFIAVSGIVSGNVSGGYQFLFSSLNLIGWHCDVTEGHIVSENFSGSVSEKY
jgi:hypothetical protein